MDEELQDDGYLAEDPYSFEQDGGAFLFDEEEGQDDVADMDLLSMDESVDMPEQVNLDSLGEMPDDEYSESSPDLRGEVEEPEEVSFATDFDEVEEAEFDLSPDLPTSEPIEPMQSSDLSVEDVSVDMPEAAEFAESPQLSASDVGQPEDLNFSMATTSLPEAEVTQEANVVADVPDSIDVTETDLEFPESTIPSFESSPMPGSIVSPVIGGGSLEQVDQESVDVSSSQIGHGPKPVEFSEEEPEVEDEFDDSTIKSAGVEIKSGMQAISTQINDMFTGIVGAVNDMQRDIRDLQDGRFGR